MTPGVEEPPLTDAQVAQYRAALGIVVYPEATKPDPSYVINPDALEALDEFFDRQCLPRDRLTPAEKEIMWACREEFGTYDPASVRQVQFVERLRALARAWHDPAA